MKEAPQAILLSHIFFCPCFFQNNRVVTADISKIKLHFYKNRNLSQFPGTRIFFSLFFQFFIHGIPHSYMVQVSLCSFLFFFLLCSASVFFLKMHDVMCIRLFPFSLSKNMKLRTITKYISNSNVAKISFLGMHATADHSQHKRSRSRLSRQVEILIIFRLKIAFHHFYSPTKCQFGTLNLHIVFFKISHSI